LAKGNEFGHIKSTQMPQGRQPMGLEINPIICDIEQIPQILRSI